LPPSFRQEARKVPKQQKKPVERLAYRTGELAEAWGVSRWTVDRLITSGELATTRVGSLTVVTVDEVESYLARHQSRATPNEHGHRLVAQPDASDYGQA
jgi:excisionase family DNA binding protein